MRSYFPKKILSTAEQTKAKEYTKNTQISAKTKLKQVASFLEQAKNDANPSKKITCHLLFSIFKYTKVNYDF